MWETIEAVELIPNWHIEFICDELQAVYERWAAGEKQSDILINVPPGSSKSTICTQLFPAWLWVKNQSIRVISSSYAADLSTAHAVKTRDCLTSDKFKLLFPGLIEFKQDTAGKTHYKNTQKGERFITSTGGRVTGMHGDFIIDDDPISPEGAASDADLKKAGRFSKTTLSSRKTDKKRSVTIRVMQRLHENDPAGLMLSSKKKINHICLPGEISDNISPIHLKERYINGLLDVNRLTRETLDDMKDDLGSYGYANQVMQESAPSDGGIWGRWFISIADNIFPNADIMVGYGTDWDTAYTADQLNDACAFCTSGMIEGNMYIDKLGYFRAEFPEMIHKMSFYPETHYIEQKASGKSAKQTLKNEGINAVEVPVIGGDKIARTRMATPPAESGRIYIRESLISLLYDDHEQGILKFPNMKHDDVNDTLVQAIQRHFKKKKKWEIY